MKSCKLSLREVAQTNANGKIRSADALGNAVEKTNIRKTNDFYTTKTFFIRNIFLHETNSLHEHKTLYTNKNDFYTNTNIFLHEQNDF